MSGDVEITVTCPAGRAEQVADAIAAEHGCRTAFRTTKLAYTNDGIKKIALDLFTFTDRTVHKTTHHDRNTGTDQEQPLGGLPRIQHGQSHADQLGFPGSSVTHVLRELLSVLRVNTEALARVVDHVGELTSHHDAPVTHQSSPSFVVGDTPNVGERPGPASADRPGPTTRGGASV